MFGILAQLIFELLPTEAVVRRDISVRLPRTTHFLVGFLKQSDRPIELVRLEAVILCILRRELKYVPDLISEAVLVEGLASTIGQWKLDATGTRHTSEQAEQRPAIERHVLGSFPVCIAEKIETGEVDVTGVNRSEESIAEEAEVRILRQVRFHV